MTAYNNWTVDENGEYVDWTKPPYTDDRGSYILVLKGEDPQAIPTHIRKQRWLEHAKLYARKMKQKPITEENQDE